MKCDATMPTKPMSRFTIWAARLACFLILTPPALFVVALVFGSIFPEQAERLGRRALDRILPWDSKISGVTLYASPACAPHLATVTELHGVLRVRVGTENPDLIPLIDRRIRSLAIGLGLGQSAWVESNLLREFTEIESLHLGPGVRVDLRTLLPAATGSGLRHLTVEGDVTMRTLSPTDPDSNTFNLQSLTLSGSDLAAMMSLVNRTDSRSLSRLDIVVHGTPQSLLTRFQKFYGLSKVSLSGIDCTVQQVAGLFSSSTQLVDLQGCPSLSETEIVSLVTLCSDTSLEVRLPDHVDPRWTREEIVRVRGDGYLRVTGGFMFPPDQLRTDDR